MNGYTYIIDEGRSADTTINIDSIELFTCIIVNKSAHNVVIYNDADLNTSSTMCPAGCTALFQLSYDTGSVFSSYILPAQDLGEGIVGYVAKTSRTDGQPDHYVSYVGTSGGVTLDLTNNCNASGRVIQLTGANANFTPSTGMPTGAAWVIEQASTGVATVVPGSCTLTGESAGYKTAGQYARIYVEHVGSDVYRVIGGVP